MAWEGIGNALSGFGTYLDQKPEQFAIMADALGQGFDPNNPFAGVGSMMGKSSLANTARQEQQAMLAQMLGGGVGQVNGQVNGQVGQVPRAPGAGMTPQQMQATQQQTGFPTLGQTQVPMPDGQNFNFLSPNNQKGPTGISYTRKPDGSLGMSMSGLAEPAPSAAQNNPSMKREDFLNFSKALSGGSDLTGLSPAEIGALTSQDVGIAEVGRKRMSDLADERYKVGQTKAAMATAESTNRANQALSLQRRSKAAMNKVETAIKAGKAPEEIAKLQAEANKLKHEGEALDLEIAQSWERQQILNKMEHHGLNIGDLTDREAAILYGDKSANIYTSTLTQNRLATQSRITNEQQRQEAFSAAEANIESALRTEDFDTSMLSGEISAYNLNAPDGNTQAYLPTPPVNRLGFDVPAGVSKVTLPKYDRNGDGNPEQLTMKDVRAAAQRKGVSVEVIINNLLQAAQGG